MMDLSASGEVTDIEVIDRAPFSERQSSTNLGFDRQFGNRLNFSALDSLDPIREAIKVYIFEFSMRIHR